ncbi:MAG: ATP-binding protein [Candidatus Bipolaricaulota bacterium]|nr:ATP-binding protein [Candidatus Bipolaricaulota bacterium]MDW8110749.1 ATP-binding protein [Candidatus Bipolaricaulota bacterium]MDW8328393.1 ATP-binding protein [Candidatus Bipolaricaulota bacterium]
MTDQAELERRLRAKANFAEAPTEPSPLRPLGEDEIGRLCIAEELSIATDDQQTHIEVYLPEDKRNEIALGDYVVIPLGYKDYKIFASVEKLCYRKRDALDDMSEVHVLVSAERLGEDDYIETAVLTPISMIGPERQALEVRYIPKPNTIVRKVASEDEVKIGLDIPDQGLFLGFVAVNGEPIQTRQRQYVPYYLINDEQKTGDPMIFTHVLIAGMSGRGKTHVAKNFLRQIIGSVYPMERRGGEQRKPCLVIIDPENEYWKMREDPHIAKEDREMLFGHGIKFGGVKDQLTVYAAVEGEARYTGCPKYTNFTIPFTLVRDFPYLIAGGELDENQYLSLVQLVRDFFAQREDGTYEEFRRFVDDPKTLEKYKESGKIHPATFQALQRRVDRAHFERIFDQGANPLTQLYNDIFAEDVVSVFATKHLSPDAERIVVLAILSMIADAKLKSAPTDWGRRIEKFPIVLVVDEAHRYFTKDQTEQDRIIVEKFIKAAKQGRKHRLALVLITQNPQDVNEAVLSQLSTRVLLGMEREMAEKAGAPARYQKVLPYFERGRMVVHAPDNSKPLELRGLDFCLVGH